MRNALVSRLCPFVFAAAVSAQGAGFEPPTLQTVLNSTSIDTEPCLSFDGLTLWFYSNRTGGVGGLDIYSTTRSYSGGPWSAPVLDVSLSSPQSDSAPFIVLGDTEIYFSSNRPGSVPIANSTTLSVAIVICIAIMIDVHQHCRASAFNTLFASTNRTTSGRSSSITSGARLSLHTHRHQHNHPSSAQHS